MSGLGAKLRKRMGWVRRYGVGRAVLYTAWEAVTHPTLRIGPWVRPRVQGLASGAYRRLGIAKVLAKVNDLELTVDPRNPWVIRAFLLTPDYDAAEIAAVKAAVPRAYTFVDIGANFGVWTFSLADHFEQVLAFEPHPDCCRCLRDTAQRLESRNVRLLELGLSDSEGRGTLYSSVSNMGDGRIFDPKDGDRGRGHPIRQTTFDALRVTAPRLFIKLDVQGAEPMVLRGMRETLRRAEDVILFMEIQESMLRSAGSSIPALLALLRELGFAPVDLAPEFPVTGWDQVVASRSKSRDYCFRRTVSVGAPSAS